MRSFAVFFFYVAGAYAVAALLSLPLAGLIDAVPPNKLISRGGMLLALAGFWYFLKLQQVANKTDLGYALAPPRFRRDLGLGLLLGILILTALAAALLLLDIRDFNAPRFRPPLYKVLLQGLLGGLAVAFIEETFFRGAMYSAIRRHGGSITATLVLTSLLYAVVHFFKPLPPPAGQPYDLATALATYWSAYEHMFRAEHLDSLVALFLVGLFLALVRRRTGHIAWAIGLHAGWVLVIKLTQSYTHVNEDAALLFLIGGYDDVIGWLAAGWIGLLCLVPAFWPKTKPR